MKECHLFKIKNDILFPQILAEGQENFREDGKMEKKKGKTLFYFLLFLAAASSVVDVLVVRHVVLECSSVTQPLSANRTA